MFADVIHRWISYTFPLEIWAEPDIDSKYTMNGCERFHREFGDIFNHSHPAVFEFLDKLDCGK